MPSFRTRAGLVLSTLLLSTVAASPALAADPDTADQWGRWIATPREGTVRSLDFIGPLLFAGTESDGVFTSPTAPGPWTQQNAGLDGTTSADDVRQVKVAPSGLVYAATSAGLFRSPAGQGGWTQVGGGTGARKLNMGGIQSIMFNGPSGTDMTVAVAGAAGAGVYFSSDNGEHWDRASGMSNPEAVYALSSGPLQTPMYAAADNGVYSSLDFGRSWILTSDGIPPGETTLRVAVSPTNPADLYASTSSSVYRSSTAGVTWEEAAGKDGQTLPSGGKRAFLLTPDLSGKFGPARALVGTEQGVYATIDNGDHWKPMSGRTFIPDSGTAMKDRIVWSLGLGFTTPVIMAGTQGFGVFNAPVLPLGGGAPTITPTSGLKAGTELKAANLDETNNDHSARKYLGFTGTKPYFFDYQWRKCDAAGNNCADIAGAKGTSYVIPTADANTGARYALKVTARNIVSPQPVTVTSPLTTGSVAALASSFPYAKSPFPTLTFTNPGPASQPAWDSVLTIGNGSWRTDANPSVTPTAFKYRWDRCDGNGNNCKEMPGAKGQTYTITKADIGSKIAGYVSATVAGITSAWSLAGSQSNVVLNRFPVNDDKPKVVGDLWTGRTVSASAGGWTGHAMTFTRRWLRCNDEGLQCAPTNPVQTGQSYALTAADKGSRLQLEVTATAADPSQARVTKVYSDPSAVVTDPPPPPADPILGGQIPVPGGNQPGPGAQPGAPQSQPLVIAIKTPKKLKVGATLPAPKSVAGYSKVKYQWLRNGKKIKKATKRTYKLTKSDRGKRISCRLTLTPAAGGTPVVVTTTAVKIPKK
ncbi:MAG: hypothetical protein JHD16_12840 [Solirubrobacteraceae bacterium]|nr:hypothetical protein [Solirubrobacteraceae bacterium]